MKPKQAAARLRKVGVEVLAWRGKGGHALLRYRGRTAVLPMHGGREVPRVAMLRTCKELLDLAPAQCFMA